MGTLLNKLKRNRDGKIRNAGIKCEGINKKHQIKNNLFTIYKHKTARQQLKSLSSENIYVFKHLIFITKEC